MVAGQIGHAPCFCKCGFMGAGATCSFAHCPLLHTEAEMLWQRLCGLQSPKYILPSPGEKS